MCGAAKRRLAVGFFDGLHLGHRQILEGADAVLTFANHPLSVLNPSASPRLIMSKEARLAALAEACGGKVEALEFDAALAAMPAVEFLERFRGYIVSCGGNWRFGRGAEGTPETLTANGIEVEVAKTVEYQGAPISSSRIRACIEAGRIDEAVAMLGHPYAVSGTCVSGKGLGRKLGFPTVNVVPSEIGLHLQRGVYAVDCGGRRAVANYGTAPTMGEQAWRQPVFELHFLDGEPEVVSGESIEFSIMRFVRPEIKFSSTDDLVRQITADCGIIAAL